MAEERDSVAAQLGYLTRAVEEVHDDVREARMELSEHRTEARVSKTDQDKEIHAVRKEMEKFKGMFYGGSAVLTAVWALVTFLAKG